MTNYLTSPVALSVTGVTKAHAKRAVRWMRDRSLSAFYRPADKSLAAFEFKDGRDWTYDTLHTALKETAK